MGAEDKSLLMWECGLKQLGTYRILAKGMSLLMWECGLKHKRINQTFKQSRVTPYVGVWIETYCIARLY